MLGCELPEYSPPLSGVVVLVLHVVTASSKLDPHGWTRRGYRDTKLTRKGLVLSEKTCFGEPSAQKGHTPLLGWVSVNEFGFTIAIFCNVRKPLRFSGARM